MGPLELLSFNLLSPPVLAFVLGICATLLRSDLKFPDELYSALTIYLLLSLGLKGGAELAHAGLSDVWRPGVATLGIGLVTPVIAWLILRHLGRFGVSDSAAIAAHYGSVSVVTFIATLAFLDALKVSVEPFMPTLVVVLEVPAIVVALVIAERKLGGGRPWGRVIREILVGKSILLLIGGLAIGLLSGPKGIARVEPFFMAPFQGVVTLFLLEMGMVAARRLRDLGKVGPFLFGFAVVVPLLFGAMGVVAGYLSGLTYGGATVLGAMAASASYIAAPAAVRIALPEANPSFYLTAALGVTFPFNLTVGIPVYLKISRLVFGVA